MIHDRNVKVVNTVQVLTVVFGAKNKMLNTCNLKVKKICPEQGKKTT